MRQKAPFVPKPKSARALRRESEREAHRRAMLKAAEDVFAEKGFERATMEEVADRAAFSVGALYNFFDSKDALFGEVIRGIAHDFYARFRDLLKKAATPFDAICGVVRLHLEEVNRHGAFFRMVMAERPGSLICPDSAIPTECRAIYDTYLDDLARLFEKAMGRRQIRKVDPRYAVLALEGAMHAYAAYWQRREYVLSVEEQIHVVMKNFVNGLLKARKGN